MTEDQRNKLKAMRWDANGKLIRTPQTNKDHFAKIKAMIRSRRLSMGNYRRRYKPKKISRDNGDTYMESYGTQEFCEHMEMMTRVRVMPIRAAKLVKTYLKKQNPQTLEAIMDFEVPIWISDKEFGDANHGMETLVKAYTPKAKIAWINQMKITEGEAEKFEDTIRTLEEKARFFEKRLHCLKSEGSVKKVKHKKSVPIFQLTEV